jgi:hypothetical protein
VSESVKRDSMKPVSKTRLRVRDEAPPSSPVVAAAPTPTVATPPREAKVTAAQSELAKAATNVDSVSRPRDEAARRAPAPAVADAMRPRATVDTVRKLESVIATAAPSAAVNAAVAGGVARPAARELAMKNAVDAQSKSVSLLFTSADDRALALPGCFQIVRDSGAPALQVPDRFSLERTSDATRHNIVRALTPDGRRDSLIAGITWQPAPGADRFVLIEREGAPSLRQQVPSSPVLGATGFARVAPLRLARVDCR